MYYFAAVQQTSTAKFYLFFQKFFKKVRDLRVNETKVIWEKALTVNLFALEREEKSKNNEWTFFRDCSWILNLSVNS